MDAISCEFTLARWHAVSTRLPDAAAWQAWAQGVLNPEALPDVLPDVSFLPAMQRRRLGTLARLLFAAAWPLLEEGEHCPLVLVSHDGEINRGFELWSALYSAGDVSPTSFGLSVHNALAGQWSMLRGDMSEHTALAIGDEALECALLDACGFLHDGAPQVLLVFADEALAPDYAVHGVQRPPFAHALALLLRPGREWRISRHDPLPDQAPADWGALGFLRQHIRGNTQWQQHYARSRWQWQRN